jgi:hypothetical protein
MALSGLQREAIFRSLYRPQRSARMWDVCYSTANAAIVAVVFQRRKDPHAYRNGICTHCHSEILIFVSLQKIVYVEHAEKNTTVEPRYIEVQGITEITSI